MPASFHQEGKFESISFKNEFISLFFIEVPVARRKSELSYFGVVGVSICSLSVILLLDFRTVPPV